MPRIHSVVRSPQKCFNFVLVKKKSNPAWIIFIFIPPTVVIFIFTFNKVLLLWHYCCIWLIAFRKGIHSRQGLCLRTPCLPEPGRALHAPGSARTALWQVPGFNGSSFWGGDFICSFLMLSWFFLSTWACQGRETQGPAESVTESCPGSVWLIHLHTFQNSWCFCYSGREKK